MLNQKKIALITGANKGIGFETAKKLAAQGMTVFIGARNEERGMQAVEKLRAENADVHYIQIDLNNHETIEQAYIFFQERYGYLDILVNNAGIIDAKDGYPSNTSIETIRHTFDTNFFGTVVVTQKMLPLLSKAKAARIVNVSSGLGSLVLNQDPEWEFYSTKLIGYNASKAALNMFTVQLAWELKDTFIKVNSANPNFTDTDLVPGAVGGKPVEDGAKIVIQLALLPDDGPTGGFFEEDQTLPW